jgi:hypothetical protein
MPANSSRSAALSRSRTERFDSWFKDRRWRVLEEMSGQRERDGSTVIYDAGEFWVSWPGIFQTPLGHRGRHGFLIREVDPQTGADLEPAVDVAFGFVTLSTAVERYQAVRGLPSEPRKVPPSPTR